MIVGYTLPSVYAIYGGCAFSAYFIALSSPNRKYESLGIVYGEVLKQWYALYVLLYSYQYTYISYRKIQLVEKVDKRVMSRDTISRNNLRDAAA